MHYSANFVKAQVTLKEKYFSKIPEKILAIYHNRIILTGQQDIVFIVKKVTYILW